MSLRTMFAPIRPSPTMPSWRVSVAGIVSSVVSVGTGGQPRLVPVGGPLDQPASLLRPPGSLRVHVYPRPVGPPPAPPPPSPLPRCPPGQHGAVPPPPPPP